MKGEGGLIILGIDRLGKVLEGIKRRRNKQRETEIETKGGGRGRYASAEYFLTHSAFEFWRRF